MGEELRMTTDELAIERFELGEKLKQPYLSEARKADIRRRIAHVSFELESRADDAAIVDLDPPMTFKPVEGKQ